MSVTATGAVCLGSDVTCDGFRYGYPVRVQTHVHADHMTGFEESKGFQDIVMTSATRALLTAEYNADIPYRQNVQGLDFGTAVTFGSSRIQLLPSGHMLGAAQVYVETDDGQRLGYSGDFAWPIEHVMHVDALVVDSTYGSSDSIHAYSQEAAENRLVEIIRDRRAHGSIHLHAHRGTLERALQVLSASLRIPVVASPLLWRRIQVFHEYGYAVPSILQRGTPAALDAASTESVVHLYSTGDRKPVDYGNDTTIVLSAFTVAGDEPVLEYSDRAYRVALTDHADFLGTLEYIRATRATYVLVDNSRGGHALELAQHIRSRLGIHAEVSTASGSRLWGE